MSLPDRVIHVFCLVALTSLLARLPAAAAQTVPIWQSTFISSGTNYTVRLVGTDPAKGGVTTTIANTIVPMRLVFANGLVLDATSDVNGLVASPIYTATTFPSGNTQFADAVLRGELWQSVAGGSYHVLLGTPSLAPTYVLAVPAADGTATKGPRGAVAGIIDYAWFVKVVQPAVVAQLGVAPSSLTIFLTHNVQLKKPGKTCCYHGNHTSFDVVGAGGRERFTTVWAGAGVGIIDTMAHEIAEWANDPFNDNLVPPWEKPGVDDCNTHLEVGDPLTGVRFRAGGYVLQDVAFAQWFSRQIPSTAIDGKYDMIGALTSVSHDCTDRLNANGAAFRQPRM